MDNVNNNTVDTTSPLVREEMAAFITYYDNVMKASLKTVSDAFIEQNKLLNNTLNKMAVAFNDIAIKTESNTLAIKNGLSDLSYQATRTGGLISELNNNVVEAASTISNSAELLKTTMYNVAKKQREAMASARINPIFHSTTSNKDRLLWAEKMRHEIAKICIEENTDEDGVYNIIYNEIESSSGYDLDKLLNEYRITVDSNATMMDMIVNSNELKLMFNNSVNNRHYIRRVKELKNSANSSSMKSITQKYFGKSTLPGRQYKAIYKIMGIDRPTYMAEAIKKYGLSKHAKMGDVLAYDHDMLKEYEKAVIKYKTQRDF